MVSEHPLASRDPVLRRLTWLICRAFRRMARILDVASVMLARNLRMWWSLPAMEHTIPDPPLADLMRHIIRDRMAIIRTLKGRALAATFRQLHACNDVLLTAAGDRRKWRLRAAGPYG